ncbi:MAG: hypothetical protein ABL914_08495 [Novosphingobium sp.]|uniref:hypothetical protein n=1 Tax=Novosphingobium sp. TaxID=1874826 RepID=UPI0032BAB6CA
MSILRTLSIALSGAAMLALAQPALAEQTWPTPEETARAFKVICLDNPGDQKTQARIATSAPWSLVKSKDSDDKRVYYDKFPWQVTLTKTESGLHICAVTTGAPGETSDAQARTAAIKVLSPRPADIENEEGGFSWTFKNGGLEYLVLYQMQTFENEGNPLTVISYGLSW